VPEEPEEEDKPTESIALEDLGKRLRHARKKEPEAPSNKARGQSFGLALRLSTELIAGVVVGGLIGLGLDMLFGTTPWLMLVFFFMGSGAGILNVMHTAQGMNEKDADSGKE
jgi:ATP synthase protein I